MANTHRRKLLTRWIDMKRRCYNTERKDYPRYGGRGITVCDRWLESFDNFYNDMINDFRVGLTLDRIDYNGSYSPENCRWLSTKEQNNNTRRNRNITLNGETKTLQQWIELYNLKSSTVKQRFYVYGWSIERSLGIEDK